MRKSELFVDVRICHGGSMIRTPTDSELEEHLAVSEEIAQAKEALRLAKLALDNAFVKCKHTVSVDKEELFYDFRFCATCGKPHGIVMKRP